MDVRQVPVIGIGALMGLSSDAEVDDALRGAKQELLHRNDRQRVQHCKMVKWHRCKCCTVIRRRGSMSRPARARTLSMALWWARSRACSGWLRLAAGTTVIITLPPPDLSPCHLSAMTKILEQCSPVT
ncbi:hypothetical protein PC128_g18708 [Phytophthora cactorum]|nr:hypothetical protein PC128_g18708 [Phytophthora cactorum]